MQLSAGSWVTTTEGPRRPGSSQARIVVRDATGHALPHLRFLGVPDNFTVYRIETSEGFSVCCLAEHQIEVAEVSRHCRLTTWKTVSELREGDTISLACHRDNGTWVGPGTEDEGYLLGILLGDGNIRADAAVISVWQQPGAASLRAEVEKRAQRCIKRRADQGWRRVTGRAEFRFKSAGLLALAVRFGMGRLKAIAEEIERASSLFYAGFLRGLFDADGSVQGTQSKGISVRLSQSDLGTLTAVLRMLARLGIISSIYRYRRDVQLKDMPDGKGGKKAYKLKPQHELVIANDNLGVFRDRVGFADLPKRSKLNALLARYKRTPNRERFVARVKRVERQEHTLAYSSQLAGGVLDMGGILVRC